MESDSDVTLVLSDGSNEEEQITPHDPFSVQTTIFSLPAAQEIQTLPQISEKCSAFCTSRCFDHSLTEEDLKELKKVFKKNKITKTKEAILHHLLSMKIAGMSHHRLTFKGHNLCPKFFSHLSGISLYIVNKVIRDVSEGVVKYEHGNTGVKKEGTGVNNFAAWILVFIENFGQNSPEDQVVVLPEFLSKAELFRIYRNEAQKPLISKSCFYEQMTTKFGPFRKDASLPWVRISAFSTHSVCDTCLAISQYQRFTKTDAQRVLARTLKEDHRLKYSNARLEVSRLIQRSINFPEESMVILMDSCFNLWHIMSAI